MDYNERNMLIAFILVIAIGFLEILNWLQVFGLCLCLIITWKWRHILNIILTLPRDVNFVYRLISVIRTNRALHKKNESPASLLSARALATPDAPCFIFKERTWTYRQIEDYSWRVARVFSQMGLAHGDVVALMCSNCPEFVAIWVGLSRLGVVTALINTNLRYTALTHSLKVASPRVVIASSELCSAVLDVCGELAEDCKLMKFCGAHHPDQEELQVDKFIMLDPLLRNALPIPIQGLPPPNYRNKLIYIYTSGTTGFPKAAVLLNSRYLFATVAAMVMLPLLPKDRMYNPLPLYHTAGGIVGVGPAICFGIPVVIREKFSASAYWKECAQFGCTVGQYIGEMCRYLLAVPPSDLDTAHNIRLVVGNGLRSAIWSQFVNRFNVPQVVELYGATEGNANIVNVDGTIGAVGFLPLLLPHRFNPIGLVQVDADTGEIVRKGPNKFCVRCKPGEPGMFIGKIEEGDATREFHGYVDKSASKKKIAENVFAVGDKFFLSGDILVMDEKGYLYFKDRTGDTFRWKGENVATAEVEAAISSAVGLRDACVYGVEIPGAEGRAGMATVLDADHTLDVSALGQSLSKALPSYAQPLFLRIAEKIDLTGTYKLKKNELQKQGFDPAVVKDKILFRASGKGEYAELTQVVFNDIMSGKVRV